MPAAAWMTVVVAALIVALTAVALLRIIFHLRAVGKTLAALIGGVEVVAARTSTVPEALTSVNASLKPVRDFCEGVLSMYTGWWIGYTIGLVVVVAVVALVTPILLLARSIGKQAQQIDESLQKSVRNTAPLAALRTTIEHATIIIGGLQRGRSRLGG